MAAVEAMITPLSAQISFTDFSSVSGLTLNGSAVQAGNVLRLTADGTNHVTGTAWFSPRQPVTGSFSTTFSFRITHASQPADGIAFVIQNTITDDSGLNAVGGSGGAIGYGVRIPGTLAPPSRTAWRLSLTLIKTAGIPMQTTWRCKAAELAQIPKSTLPPVPAALLGWLQYRSNQTTLADGGVHTATITYVPPPSGTGPGLLDVILDNHDLFPGGLSFNWSTLSLTTGTSAFVGFTGSTGGSTENNDILSWTFTPQTQSAALPAPGVQGSANFSGGVDQGGFDQTATIGATSPVTSATLNIKAIPIDRNVVQQTGAADLPLGAVLRLPKRRR